MSKLNCVILDSEVVGKSECFVEFVFVIFVVKVVFVIIDIESFPSPHFFPSLITFLRLHRWLHAHAIERLGFVLDSSKGTRLTMLNLAMKLLLLFFILKLNHCVNAFVLRSF